MSMKEARLSHERLLKLLEYSPESGLFHWRLDRRQMRAGDLAGSKMQQGHVTIRIDGLAYYAHRMAWFYIHGFWPRAFVDHRNGVRDDNRICNLRQATRSINAQNQSRPQRHNQTGLLGVTYQNRLNGYRAHLSVSGKKICLGSFPTKESAHAAYVDAKRRLHAGCSI